jgi:curved DNA-binding protein CbpA
MNPYATLGIDKRASKKTIKAAFRRRAMATHPDRGGNPEEFQAVSLAYRILSDDAARKRFNETGQYETGPDNTHGPIIDAVAHAFGIAVQMAIDQGHNPKEVDMVAAIVGVLDARLKEQQEAKKSLSRAEAALCQTIGRFSVAVIDLEHQENMLEAIAASHVANVRKQIAQAEANIAGLRESKAFVKRHKFKSEMAEMVATFAGSLYGYPVIVR